MHAEYSPRSPSPEDDGASLPSAEFHEKCGKKDGVRPVTIIK